MRTIQALLSNHEVAWIYLDNKEIGSQFLKQAKEEGFHFSNGQAPEESDWGYVMAIHKDKTIAHLSLTIWVMSFQAHVTSAPVKIDYEKYAAGEENYICEISHFTGSLR